LLDSLLQESAMCLGTVEMELGKRTWISGD